ncbi:hypothetical protein GGX14DRAFT_606650 [Mycena pura]|uniref:Uncharacterized protein n=1 Tax=Mycena pura TaxID=153505 RepID=A0AAD6Y3H9_9AGAR|nr:hypothetical protein GGX14DRAFT_606650 [Mycena pura]
MCSNWVEMPRFRVLWDLTSRRAATCSQQAAGNGQRAAGSGSRWWWMPWGQTRTASSGKQEAGGREQREACGRQACVPGRIMRARAVHDGEPRVTDGKRCVFNARCVHGRRAAALAGRACGRRVAGAGSGRREAGGGERQQLEAVGNEQREVGRRAAKFERHWSRRSLN